MKNLKEFKALKKRYESITLKEIKTKNINTARHDLTGFGMGCSLCYCTCKNCVYGSKCMCFKDDNEKTFIRISHADTPLKLLNAYRARAKHMKTLIKS